MAAEEGAPINFASKSAKSRRFHEHTEKCKHPQVKDDQTSESCATAHLLNTLPHSMERLLGKGTLPTELHQAKTTVAQMMVSTEMATQETGLVAPLARVLTGSHLARVLAGSHLNADDEHSRARVQACQSFLKFGMRKRGGKSNEMMNEDLVNGRDVERKNRSDYYNRRIPYNYFHGLGDGPDFCPLVEINKNKRGAWAGKPFQLGNEELTLTCMAHSRRGTCQDLCDNYRLSETCLK